MGSKRGKVSRPKDTCGRERRDSRGKMDGDEVETSRRRKNVPRLEIAPPPFFYHYCDNIFLGAYKN